MEIIKEVNQYLNNTELKNYVFHKDENIERDEIVIQFNHLDYAQPCYEFAKLLEKFHSTWIGTYHDKLTVSFR